MAESKALRVTTACTLLATMPVWMTGCPGQAPNGGNAKAPEIPLESTFVMDFGDFADAGASKAIVDAADAAAAQMLPGTDWLFAAFNVGAWSVIITVGLAVPVAAFLESFNHEPAQLEDGTWVWSYDVTVVGVGHSAELHALAVDGDIQWKMFITQDGFYEEFNWFSGVSNLVGTEGTWTLNRSPEDPTPFVGIEWHRDPQAETGDVKYTNIVPGGPESGGYIFHGLTDETYDAFFDIYNKGQDNLTRIEWSRSTKDGHVRDSAHFGDEDWHCWDAALQDTACP
ncbi:MAG: hypothetical protein PVI86_16270 [Phycisphaerae bacterium]|jgi:hypothetical protein